MKHVQVFEMGTPGKVTPQNGYMGGTQDKKNTKNIDI
jgi:hypothetical protein